MAVKLERIVKTYYDKLEEGKIMGRYCPECGNMEWPPVYACNKCGNMETEWKEIDGNGEMFLLIMPSVMSLKPELKDLEPYAYACVRLVEGPERNVLVRGITKANEAEIRAHMPYPVHASIVQRDGYKTVVFDLGPKEGTTVTPSTVEETSSAGADVEKDEVLSKLIEMVTKAYHAEPGTVTGDTEFNSFHANSVVFVGLTAQLEDEFDVMVSITEAGSAKTVKDLAELVKKEMA